MPNNLPFKKIQIEISGKCNAKCPYCITGQRNINGEGTGAFINPDKIKICFERLKYLGFIDKSTVVSLYNYGEPLLHPMFSNIIELMENTGYYYDISTNCSRGINEETIKKMTHLKTLQFSMPGFSQDSYDKIHGFSFQTVKKNIMHIIDCLRKHNIETECILKLQMYSFNESEIQDAISFSKKMGMNVIPLHAIYANLDQQMTFVEKYNETKTIPENSEQLWYYLPRILSKPTPPRCPQWDSMVVDENLDIALCCMVTKKMPVYKMGDIYSVSKRTLLERENSMYCRKCLSTGTARSICMTPSYIRKLPVSDYLSKHSQIVVLGSGALEDSFRTMFPKYSGSSSVSLGYLQNLQNKQENVGYIVVADKNWWKIRPILIEMGFREDSDFYIYNTYLRDKD